MGSMLGSWPVCGAAGHGPSTYSCIDGKAVQDEITVGRGTLDDGNCVELEIPVSVEGEGVHGAA